MKIQRFLEYHGLQRNPFADEDAQTDPVFKDYCIDHAYHPAWDKIYGNPSDPSTSIVFGEKGAGKTALRLQICRRSKEHNHQHPKQRAFLIEYDDFNPFLDHFAERFSARSRRQGKTLSQFRLWDHMDAILALGVTKLMDSILGVSFVGRNAAEEEALSCEALTKDRPAVRDLLLLAACYDRSMEEDVKRRWHRLSKLLKYPHWQSVLAPACGAAWTILVLGITLFSQQWSWFASPWWYVILSAGWWYWAGRSLSRLRLAFGISRRIRVMDREINRLRRILMCFSADDLALQPLPNKDRTDDRYELLLKFQNILRLLNYSGVAVLVDRVDEPHLINGSSQQMRALLWPLLDNKLLKHPGLGFKLLLPIELSYYMEHEDRDFHQRARLDKQNVIPSLQWTGEALFDVANARLTACAASVDSDSERATPEKESSLRAWFSPEISDSRIVEAFRSLRVPRHLFKFLYRLLMAHANAYTDAEPEWQITPSLFESTLALYQREQDAHERGLGMG